jgi:hypothetical protein
MRLRPHACLLALCLPAALPPPAARADLGKVERTIAREPASQSKAPRYCLLVFGREARTRVWLVLDGHTLYVDRNGNGDLTEEGERVRMPNFEPSRREQYTEEREVVVGDVRDGRLTHTGLRLTQYRIRKDYVPQAPNEEVIKEGGMQDPDGLIYELSVAVEVRPRPGDKVAIAGRIVFHAGSDPSGCLLFAARPQEAPVVHFGGPLRMALLWRQVLPRGDKPGDLTTCVGSAGLGRGTFASVPYGGLIADDVHPVAEIAFPAREKGGPPLRQKVVLTHRC